MPRVKRGVAANKRKKRIVVDTGGSHLRPRRRGSCQRLGLGPPVVAAAALPGESGEVLLRIEPGASTTLLMNTVCLDANRSAPRTHSFVGVAEPLPEVREKVLRWWVDLVDAREDAGDAAAATSSPARR